MLRFNSMPLTFSIILAAALLPAAVFAQSQESVAEAARRAREQKKPAAKPSKVITDDDVKHAASASSEPAPAPGAQAPPSAGAANQPAGASAVPDPKDEKASKELAALKEEIKQVQSDLDLLQRQLSLEQDTYQSNPDNAHDTAGKAKVDGIKLQAGDKLQELDRLKAHLMELLPPQTGAAAAPPKP